LIIDVDRDGVANERDFAPYIYNNQIYAGAAVVVLILGALVLGVFKLRRESRRRQALEHQNREIAQLFDLTLGMTESGISSSRCGGDSVLLGALLILRQQLDECRAQYDSGSLSYEDARTQAIDLKQQIEVLISPTAGSEKEQVDAAQTHYQVLGIDPSASQEDIRRAYREKLKRLHPDTVAAWAKDEVPQEVKDFLNDSVKRLNLAYQMLSDPEMRKEYDTTGGRSTPNG
jgi:hypothetical protein